MRNFIELKTPSRWGARLYGCRGWIRTTDLRVMSPVSWPLLYPAVYATTRRIELLFSVILLDSTPSSNDFCQTAVGAVIFLHFDLMTISNWCFTIKLRSSFMAESVGFEPTELWGSTVFKTAAINHSANFPLGYLNGVEPLSSVPQTDILPLNYKYHRIWLWLDLNKWRLPLQGNALPAELQSHSPFGVNCNRGIVTSYNNDS